MAPVARRRWLLFLLSLGSLVILAYGGVLLAFSVPVSAAMAAQAAHPGASEPEVGTRALVLPLGGPEEVVTAASGREGWQHWTGELLVVADERGDFPASSDRPELVRALAWVQPNETGAYAPPTLNLTEVPRVDGQNVTNVTLSLDVAALAGGQAGFLVKADSSNEVRFVPFDDVVGRVARFESSASILLTLVAGAIGFTAPLIALVVTHRPSGRPGIRTDGTCVECRRPLPPGADFCTGCGAWKPRGDP